MHAEAREGFMRMLDASQLDPAAALSILDLGGQNVNGVVHDLFPSSRITVLDIDPTSGADLIADACTWEPDRTYDAVVSTELLEHVAQWRDVVSTARKALTRGGVLILTCASTGRGEHGATGAPFVAPGEHYGNVHPLDLADCLSWHFTDYGVEYRQDPGDVYCWGRV